MNSSALARYSLSISIAAALLAGCGGSQPPMNISIAVPLDRANTGYRTLYNFAAIPDGQEPKAALIDVNGTLYGTTYGGGVHGCGTVFSMSTAGTEKVLYSFQDGDDPSASLVAVKGVLYGTTEYGGVTGLGSVFKVSTAGVEKRLYSFYGYYYDGHIYNDGANPVASLIDVKGRLYGTTYSGGSGEFYGTVFKITTSGKEKVLHSFSDYTDAANPGANLVDVKGTLYGTTQYGVGGPSNQGDGTVFSVSTTGTENVLYNFGSDGAYPEAGLIDIKGTLYGTTPHDGSYYGGTAFSITTTGSLTNLHSFGSGTDGSRPLAPLLDVRGTLYGTTSLGGAYGKGTIFRMSLTGTDEKALHSFGHGSDGATPLAGLIDANGTLYGTTSAGGKYGKGAVFALTP